MLETKVADKYVRQALREGAKVIQRQCVDDAPNLSGLTRKSIKVKAKVEGMKRSRRLIRMFVTIGREAYQGDSFYAAFQNYGWKAGSRKNKGYRRPITTRNFHWLNRAFDKASPAAAAKIKAVLAQKLAQGKGGGDGAG
jgi:hypothetical protein